MKLVKKIALVIAVVLGAAVHSAHALDAKNFKGTYSVSLSPLAGTTYRGGADMLTLAKVTVSKAGKISGTWTVVVGGTPTGTVTVAGKISKITKKTSGQKAAFSFTLTDGVTVKGSFTFTKPNSSVFSGIATHPNGETSPVGGVRGL